MRKMIAVIALCGSFTLGGCATTGGGPPDLSAIVAQVQQIAVQVCKFLPTAETIVNIVTAGTLSGPFMIANAICAAVTAAPSRTFSGAPKPPMVGRVVIKGKFV